LWCLSFDGNDSIEVASHASFNILSALTVEVWVNPTTYQESYICDCGKQETNQGYALKWGAADGVRFRLRTADGVETVLSSTIATGNWYYFVGTYDGTNGYIYTNGVQGDTFALTGTVTAGGDGKFHIGVRADSSQYIIADIGLIRVRNYALSSVQVPQQYNKDKWMFGL